MQAYWAKAQPTLLAELATTVDGLSQEEAGRRLAEAGPNTVEGGREVGPWRLLLRQFENPLVLILVFAAGVSAVLAEWTDAIIILVIVGGSTVLGFSQEHRASQAVQKLRARLSLRTTALRDGRAETIEARLLVPGDVILLAAGNLIPADGVVIEARDFIVSQAALTGESLPVEKSAEPSQPQAPLAERANVTFLGSSVRSGTARVVVTATGRETELARLAAHISQADEETDFERGIRRFGYLLTRIMVVIVLAVLTINLLLGRPIVDSLFFAVALAVGLSPELLPAIMSVTLSAGARRMAGQGVIVRRLDAIENLGSADILCTDKTGTLTKGDVELTAAVDAQGQPSDRVFHLAAVNALLETGIENALDAAIVARVRAKDPAFTPPPKIDEIPYDFVRKRLTIVAAEGQAQGVHLIVTKGAVDAVLDACSMMASAAGPIALDEAAEAAARAFVEAQGRQGYRVLGVASRSGPAREKYVRADETGMVFEGFLLFFDPLKEGTARTIAELAELGIATKIISGDNQYVVAHVGEAIGLDPARLMTGRQLAQMRDDALARLAPATDIFAEIDPQQKERIVRALQGNGHAVAYMGDGINDAPALKVADVGVSVDQAVDVARESADIVLLRPDLDVLRQGVVYGRRTFANTLKYIQITTSANFGNMVSMALASVFVPFLPLLAKQILLNNFLSDLPSMAISTDNVDADVTARAQRWNIRRIWAYTLVFGLASTAFDLLTFVVLIRVFDASESLFQSTWFVVSLLTELAVVLVLRTERPAWQSRPSKVLLYATLAVFAVALVLPYIGIVDRLFAFVPIPSHLLAFGLLVVATYVAATEAIKRWFYGTRGPGHRP